MNRLRFILLLSCLGLATFMCAQTPAKPKLIEFDAPGAGPGQNQGTVGTYIAADGAIAGYYIDSNYILHGFLRNADGTFATFDPAGSVNTYPEGINASHVIVGLYTDAGGVNHGFIRDAAGKVISYDAPDAGSSSGQGTVLGSINRGGEALGNFTDTNGVSHGFLLASNGGFTEFDAPNAGTGAFQGTYPAVSDGLTDQEAVGGFVYDNNFLAHGFVRAPDGTFTEFDATSNSLGTYVFGINSQQTVAGVYATPDGAGLGGFLRTSDGKIKTILVPLIGNIDTVSFGVNSINNAGALVGYYSNGNPPPPSRAYVRAPNGKVTYFKAPDAGTGPNQGTFPYANNNSGEITGTYIDSIGAYHGFIVE